MKPKHVYHMPRKGMPAAGPACGNTPAVLKPDPKATAVPCPACLNIIRDERVGIFLPGFEPTEMINRSVAM